MKCKKKMWIVFCKHTQSWWSFNYQPLSGTSWAGLQEKGKWQHGVWAPPRRSSAWKDVDRFQHKALSRPGMKRCFLSCHRTERLSAWCPFFLKHSLSLSVPLCSLPSLPSTVGVLPTLQPPHSSSLWAVGFAHKFHVILGKHFTSLTSSSAAGPPNNTAGYALQIKTPQVKIRTLLFL